MEVTIRIETQDSIINQKIKITDPNISINHFVNQLLDNLKKMDCMKYPKASKIQIYLYYTILQKRIMTVCYSYYTPKTPMEMKCA